MRGDFDEDEDPDFEPEWPDDDDAYCYRCDNTGWIMICPDDMCRGAGECMHGDGMIVCPDCKGASGE